MNRRTPIIASLAVLMLASTVMSTALRAMGSPLQSSAASCTTAQAKAGRIADFDDDGRSDLAVGAPGADSGAGGVEVREASGRVLFLAPGSAGVPGTPSAGDGFGSAVLAGNLDGDHCTDLLIGEPGLTVDGQADAGGVQILYGTPSGFAAGPLLTRGSNGVPGVAATNEHFGASLAESTGDGAGPGGFVELGLHIGVPGATVMGKSGKVHGAGSVVEVDFDQVPGARLGPSIASSEMWQGNGIGGSPVIAAHLGAVMSDRVVAAPDETLGDRISAGFVSRVNYAFDIDSAEAGYTGFAPLAIRGKYVGERLGSAVARICSLDSVIIGAPDRKVAGHADAGEVVVVKNLYRAPKVVGRVAQESSRVPGTVGGNHQFGASVSSTCDVTHNQRIADVAIGAPGTTVAGHLRAGAVALLRVAPAMASHVLTGRLITRRTKGIAGAPGGGDQFGLTLQSHPAESSGSPALTLVGAPYDDLGAAKDAGSIDELSVKPATLVVTHSTQLHHTGGGNRYGAALAD